MIYNGFNCTIPKVYFVCEGEYNNNLIHGWMGPPMYFQRHPKQGLTYWLNKGSNHALRHTYTSFKTLLSPRNKGCLWSQRVNIYERDGVSNNNYT
jgi:hypothetical protein